MIACTFVASARVGSLLNPLYLYIMQEEPGQPLINSDVNASGCHAHANEYWRYLMDSRQVITVLNNERWFLSITPDTEQLELTAPETWRLVRDLMRHEIQKQTKRMPTTWRYHSWRLYGLIQTHLCRVHLYVFIRMVHKWQIFLNHLHCGPM
jgi:hypothetical protein